jgi:hypothetical protein
MGIYNSDLSLGGGRFSMFLLGKSSAVTGAFLDFLTLVVQAEGLGWTFFEPH